MNKYNLIFVILFISNSLFSQLNPEVIQIEMRDGKTLSADVYLPNQNEGFPIILIQTPYNKNSFRQFLPLGIGTNIEDSPYGFVVLDWRCFYSSLSACAANISRGEDGYDAVEWIAKQTWSNGKVATWGPSALGNIQYQTAKEQPPALVCAVPVVASPQVYYEKTYPGGILGAANIETLGTLFGGSSTNLYLQNPYKNIIWDIAEKTTKYYDEITIPMLNIAGWFDHNIEECLENHNGLKSSSPVANQHKILIGPWVHGGASLSAPGAAQQGELTFNEAAQFNNIIAREFLDYYLLNDQNGWDQKEDVIYFQMGDNTWKENNMWPPDNLKTQTFYLNENKQLRNTSSDIPSSSVSYEYNPEFPTPTVGGKTLHPTLDQGPYDISAKIEDRADVITFTTEILKEDLSLQGKPKATLYFSTDRLDTDLVLRLCEVYPDGRSIMLEESELRLRFLNGFRKEDEKLLNLGEVYEVPITFDNLANTFKSGNRIRLSISSASYIRLNRNMNTGGEMYPNNNIDTLINPLIATNNIHVNGSTISKLELPVTKTLSNTLVVDFSKNNIYPNPADSYINFVNDGKMVLTILDQIGGVIYSRIVEGEKTIINTSNWPSGIYFANGKKVIINH